MSALRATGGFVAAFVAGAAVIGMAHAGALDGIEGVIMFYGSSGAHFDWPLVKQCAARTYRAPKADEAGGNNMLSAEWQQYEFDYRTISACRLALAARHEGWIAAAPDQPDPILPEPMMNQGDFK